MNIDIAINKAEVQASAPITTDFISAYSLCAPTIVDRQINNSGSNNQLLALMLPILTLGMKLKELSFAPNKHTLKQLLISQIESFYEKSQHISYTAETIDMARYIVCAFIDEAIIFDTTWGVTLNWEEEELLSVFFKDNYSKKNFFTILKNLYEKAGANLDLLELMYMCLSLGFMGMYRMHKEGKGNLALKELMNDLYACIIRYRKVPEQRLCIPLANRLSGLALIDPSSLDFPQGDAERTTGMYIGIHEDRERRRQHSGKPKCEGYIQSCEMMMVNEGKNQSNKQSSKTYYIKLHQFFSHKMQLILGLEFLFGCIVYLILSMQLRAYL